jgi:hypothetical protein
MTAEEKGEGMMHYDTNGPSGGPTADWPEAAYGIALAASLACGDTQRDYDRSLCKAENRADLLRFLGACMKGLEVRWWPVREAAPCPTGNTTVPASASGPVIVTQIAAGIGTGAGDRAQMDIQPQRTQGYAE